MVNVGAYTIAGVTFSIAELKMIRGLGVTDALVDTGGFALFAVVSARLLTLGVTTPYVHLTR